MTFSSVSDAYLAPRFVHPTGPDVCYRMNSTASVVLLDRPLPGYPEPWLPKQVSNLASKPSTAWHSAAFPEGVYYLSSATCLGTTPSYSSSPLRLEVPCLPDWPLRLLGFLVRLLEGGPLAQPVQPMHNSYKRASTNLPIVMWSTSET